MNKALHPPVEISTRSGQVSLSDKPLSPHSTPPQLPVHKDVQQLLGTAATSRPTKLSTSIPKSSANRLSTATPATAAATTATTTAAVPTTTSIPAGSSYRIWIPVSVHSTGTIWSSTCAGNS